MRYNIKTLACGVALATLLVPGVASGKDFSAEPGTLGAALQKEEVGTLTDIKVNGEIDVRDMLSLKNVKELENLDLSNCTLAGYSSSIPVYENRTTFKEGEIPAYMFFGMSLKSISFPSNTKSIGEGAFGGAALESLSFPETLVEIGDHAFYDIATLKSVAFPARLTRLGEYAFANCSALKSVNLAGTRLKRIEGHTFDGCVALTSVSVPTALNWVGAEAFNRSAVTSLSLPGLTGADDYALVGMVYLKEVTLNPESNPGQGMLMGNGSLEYITGAPALVPALFAANCGMLNASSVTSGAESLGAYSLRQTTGHSLVLGGSLSHIDDGALADMKDVQSVSAVSLGDRVPSLGNNVFDGWNRPEIELTVADNAVSAWKNDPEWGQFKVVANSASEVEMVPATDKGGIIIKIENGSVWAYSPSVIRLAEVYDVAGNIVISATPESEEWSMDRDDLPTGVLMVRIVTAEPAEKVVKIMN